MWEEEQKGNRREKEFEGDVDGEGKEAEGRNGGGGKGCACGRSGQKGHLLQWWRALALMAQLGVVWLAAAFAVARCLFGVRWLWASMVMALCS